MLSRGISNQQSVDSNQSVEWLRVVGAKSLPVLAVYLSATHLHGFDCIDGNQEHENFEQQTVSNPENQN